MTIICVDNTPIMLQTLQENATVAFPHANVQAFPGAEAALNYAQANGCDVLLCEINLLITVRNGPGQSIEQSAAYITEEQLPKFFRRFPFKIAVYPTSCKCRRQLHVPSDRIIFFPGIAPAELLKINYYDSPLPIQHQVSSVKVSMLQHDGAISQQG